MNRRNHDSNSRNKTLSRGGFVRSLTLGAVGTAILAATGKARAVEPSGSLIDFAVPVLDLWISMPNLPGAADITEFIDAAYPTDLSADEALMLRGALYLNADRMMQALADDMTLDAAAHVLSKPLHANPLSPLFFSYILNEAKERAATDAQFAQSVTQAGALFDQLAQQLAQQTGQPEDSGCCILLLIILLILIMMLLAHD